DVEIGEAVVVEVAGRDAHAVAANAGAAPFRDVVECAVAAIAIQPIATARGFLEQAAALYEIHIEEAVVVHVEQRGPAAHDFRQVVLGLVARAVDEADSGALGDIFEPCSGAAARGRAPIAPTAHDAAAHCNRTRDHAGASTPAHG